MKFLQSARDSRHYGDSADGGRISQARDAMPEQAWRPLKLAQCDRIAEEVALEALVVYPAEVLPDQPGRVLAHRCSQGLSCNSLDRPTCCWAGNWPGYDPFA